MLVSETETGNSKCFWIAKPDIASVAPQIFYFQDDDIAYPINTISIEDDSDNPIFNVITNSIFITLPDDLDIEWNTDDNYII